MPSHDSDWFRKDNGASGKRCDMDAKPEGSIRGNELINDVRWQWSEATWTGSPEGAHSSAHQYGVPPRGNANFAWVQHFIHHLAPHGVAGFVLANGSMSSHQSGEGDIRRVIIEADLVDCMVALPGQLFYSTQIPVCLWFLSKSKAARMIKSLDNFTPVGFRERRRETLFIDARKMGKLIDRVHCLFQTPYAFFMQRIRGNLPVPLNA